jgi:uncharacterized protein YecT (DUF1311 family)
LVLITFATPSGAAGPTKADAPSDKFTRCMKKADAVDPNMQACALDEAARQDATLNAVYKKLMAALDEPDQKAALKTAERAWIAYRDAECDFQYGGKDGGTDGRLRADECLTTLTHDRIVQLQDSLKWVAD